MIHGRPRAHAFFTQSPVLSTDENHKTSHYYVHGVSINEKKMQHDLDIELTVAFVLIRRTDHYQISLVFGPVQILITDRQTFSILSTFRHLPFYRLPNCPNLVV